LIFLNRQYSNPQPPKIAIKATGYPNCQLSSGILSKFMPQIPAKEVANPKIPAQAAKRFVISESSIVINEILT